METLTEAVGNTNATLRSVPEFRMRMEDLLAPWRAIL